MVRIGECAGIDRLPRSLYVCCPTLPLEMERSHTHHARLCLKEGSPTCHAVASKHHFNAHHARTANKRIILSNDLGSYLLVLKLAEIAECLCIEGSTLTILLHVHFQSLQRSIFNCFLYDFT